MKEQTIYPSFLMHFYHVNTGSKKDYIDSFFQQFYDNYSGQIDGEEKQKYVESCISLSQEPIEFFDSNEIINRYDQEVQKTLTDKSQMINTVMKRLLFLPQGEQVIGSEITCLRSKTGMFVPGQVVFIRETNCAKIACVLEYVKLNLDSGDVESTYLTTVTDMAATSDLYANSAVLAVGGAPPPNAVGDGSAERNALAAGIVVDIAQNIIFLLPAPWSDAVDQGLSLFEMLLPENESDPIAEAINAINDFTALHMARQKVVEWKNVISSFADWIMLQKAVLKNPNSKYNRALILKIIDELYTSVGPNGKLNGALTGLSNPKSILSDVNFEFTGDQDTFKSKKENMNVATDCLRLLAIGSSLLLLGNKFRIQLYAQLAANGRGEHDQMQFLADNNSGHAAFLEFKINSANGADENPVGWPSRIEKLINEVVADTKSMSIGFLERTDHPPGPTGAPQGGLYSFQYVENNTIEVRNIFDSNNGCCVTRHEDDANRQRNEKQAELHNAIDQKYQSFRDSVTRLKNSYMDWENNYSLPQPKEAPRVSADMTRWKDDTPKGSNWVSGNAVSYGVIYLQQKGANEKLDYPSDVSTFSAYNEITGKAFPTVEVPVDPEGKATGRAIYRTFSASQPKVELVKIIRNNTDTEFVDDKE